MVITQDTWTWLWIGFGVISVCFAFFGSLLLPIEFFPYPIFAFLGYPIAYYMAHHTSVPKFLRGKN